MKFKKMLALTGTFLLTTVLTACSGGNSSEAAVDEDGVTTLLMYQIGDKPENYDELMEIANERIEEKIDARIDLQYIGWGDWDQKMSTIISSGENFDIAFAAKGYTSNAQKGAYADLTDLAPKYAKDAYDQLDPAYIKGNLVDDKLYAFPVNGNIFGQQVLTFNKQYLDKYDLDIDDVKSYEDAEPLLKVIKEKEGNVSPFAIGQSFQLSGPFDYILGKDQPFAVDVDNPDKIVNQWDTQEMMDRLKVMHEWYQEGYIPSDAATDTQAYPLEGNNWFMREETQGPMDYGDTVLSNAAGQELVSAPITEPLKSTGQAQVANFVIGNVSKNKEKAMEFLGLLNSDPELLNGLVWGVEGEAWEKVEGEEDRIKLLDGYKANNHMPAWNTGNNLLLYNTDSLPEEKIVERDKQIEEADESPILGFNFKTDKVKTEMTNITNVMSRYQDELNTGTVDPEKTVPKLLDDLDKAGWGTVQEEMQKQYEEFKKENG